MAIRKVIVDVGGRHSPLNAGEDTIDIHSVPIASAVGNQLSEHNGGLAVFGYYEATSGKEATTANSGNPLSTGYIDFRQGSDTHRINTLTTDFVNFRVLGRKLSATVRKLLGKSVEEQYTLTVDLPVPEVTNTDLPTGQKQKIVWCQHKGTWEIWVSGEFTQGEELPIYLAAGQQMDERSPIIVAVSEPLGAATVFRRAKRSFFVRTSKTGRGMIKIEGWI